MAIPSAEQSANQIVDIFHSIAEEHVPVGVQLGIVLKFEPPSIQIAMNNIVLDEKQLYIDQFLLTGYSRSTSGTTNISNVSGNLDIGNATGIMTLVGSAL